MGGRGRGRGARRKVRSRWPRLHSLHINTHSVEEGEETFLSNRRERERERERERKEGWERPDLVYIVLGEKLHLNGRIVYGVVWCDLSIEIVLEK